MLQTPLLLAPLQILCLNLENLRVFPSKYNHLNFSQVNC